MNISRTSSSGNSDMSAVFPAFPGVRIGVHPRLNQIPRSFLQYPCSITSHGKLTTKSGRRREVVNLDIAITITLPSGYSVEKRIGFSLAYRGRASSTASSRCEPDRLSPACSRPLPSSAMPVFVPTKSLRPRWTGGFVTLMIDEFIPRRGIRRSSWSRHRRRGGRPRCGCCG